MARSTLLRVLNLEAATAAGKYTDGQAVTAGTDGYFTFYMSAKTKIDCK